MKRLIDLEARTRMLWFTFPSDARVEAAVRSLPGRRFDQDGRRWGVPMEQIASVIHQLEPLHFKLTPRCREYWLEVRDTAPAPRPATSAPASQFDVDPNDGMTVSALNVAAKRVLQQGFPDDIWLVAEIDSFGRNSARGTAYFELVERITEGGNPIAKVSAIMFGSARTAIERKLGELELRDGLVVRVKGRVSLYEAQGRFQFQVEDIDADWSVGALKRKRDKILADLDEQGLAQRNLALPLAVCPLRIGLITATSSDAYNDFVHELERSGFGFDVVVHEATMQGPQTEPSVLEALRWFYPRAADFDVVAIVRGGGARSDLTSFDSFALGRAVCLMPMKIVCGVGHHRDQCVLDFVAHSEKTPTAAAQYIAGRVGDFSRRVEQQGERVQRGSRRRLDAARARLERAGSLWQRRSTQQLRNAEDRLRRDASQLQRAATSHINRQANRLQQTAGRLDRHSQRRISAAERAVDHASRSIDPRRVEGRIQREADAVERFAAELDRALTRRLHKQALHLENLQARVRLSDPRRVVERGFALIRDPEGRVVTDAARLRELDLAAVEMRDGSVTVIPQEGDDDGQ